jgi:N-methylhydantoinase A/oxoprolinase/acetone carboxylase beta subunit
VDCGGTYTDAVIYGFESHQVLASAKHPTSHHDLARCITAVLDCLPPELMEEIGLVCLSTTLATNAIVEGRGGKACLILLGYDDCEYTPPSGVRLARVAGAHDVTGEEVESLDEAALRRAIKDNASWADSFAVSGYFSTRNPAHELRAKAIVHQETNKPVVCGHALSMRPDAGRRASTAAINARLIPVITSLIVAVQRILEERGVRAPLMVVRGDGTLMSSRMALERPVETILSGPAASVVGALSLSGCDRGVVIDIGGTTTDIAWVEHAVPPINSEGVLVGDVSTRVEAIDIRTVGLGGDSWIRLSRDGALELGPRRVLPIAMLPSSGRVIEALHRVRESRRNCSASDALTFWAKASHCVPMAANADEERLLSSLVDGPVGHVDLQSTSADSEFFLHMLKLEERQAIFRSSITPTDIFNASGECAVGDAALSRAAVETAAHLGGMPAAELIRKVKDAATELIIRQVLLFLLRLEGKDQTLLEKWIDGSRARSVRLELKLEAPIIAAGAPAAVFLSPVADRLSCPCVVPPHVEVTNAVGAVAGAVSHAEEVEIRRRSDGGFRVFASDGRYDFSDLASAYEFAIKKGSDRATALAFRAGAAEVELLCEEKDLCLPGPKDEYSVFQRSILIRAHGRPRMQAKTDLDASSGESGQNGGLGKKSCSSRESDGKGRLGNLPAC